jgi:hypothetical protein
LQVQCTNGTPYSIGLNAGAGSGATVAVRKMTHGSATIDYSLYRNNKDETFDDVAMPMGIGLATRWMSGWGLKFFDFDQDGFLNEREWMFFRARRSARSASHSPSPSQSLRIQNHFQRRSFD